MTYFNKGDYVYLKIFHTEFINEIILLLFKYSEQFKIFITRDLDLLLVVTMKINFIIIIGFIKCNHYIHKRDYTYLYIV